MHAIDMGDTIIIIIKFTIIVIAIRPTCTESANKHKIIILLCVHHSTLKSTRNSKYKNKTTIHFSKFHLFLFSNCYISIGENRFEYLSVLEISNKLKMNSK